jgi:hypothetical protein
MAGIRMERNTCRYFLRITSGKRSLLRLKRKKEYNIKINIEDVGIVI